MMKKASIQAIAIAACFLLLAVLACRPIVTIVVTATPTLPILAEATTPAIITTPTETPTPQPTAAVCTLGARWVADVTVPDNTPFAPGTAFVKTWRVHNSGTCDWKPGTKLVFISGDPMGGPATVDVPALAAGAQTDISVNLTAPAAPGTYRANYQFQAPDGTRFGPIIWVRIVVPGTPTPTIAPPPTGLAILLFSAEVVQDITPAGKRIRFYWRTQGATSTGIWSGTQTRFPKYWEATPPSEGTLIVDVETTFYRDPVMTLVARDAAGNEVRATAVVPWACQYHWFFPTDNRACPAYEASTTWAAEEPFERGRMIWLQEVRTGTAVYQKVILVFYNGGHFEKHPDTFVEGVDPESDPAIVPPPGLYQPIRGFGKLWRTNTSVRDRLGWATASEQGFHTQWQMQMAESIGIPFYVRRMDGRIIRAAGWDTGSGAGEGAP